MNEIMVKEYLGNSIQFKMVDGHIYANATSMCKAFGKQPSDWLKIKSTQEYINELQGVGTSSEGVKLVDIINDGFNNGTWIHEKLVLDLARWLNVKFRVWCDEQIATLLREGKVEIKPKKTSKVDLLMGIVTATGDVELAMAVNKYENIYVKPLELENEQQAQKIIELQPKADYCDNILKPNHVFAITHIAKDLGTTPNEVNKILEKLEIQYHGSKLMPWILRAEYDWLVPQYCDYEDFKNDFMKIPVKNLKWSEKGRMWLIETLDQAGYLEWFDGKPRVKKEGKKKCKKQAQIDVRTI